MPARRAKGAERLPHLHIVLPEDPLPSVIRLPQRLHLQPQAARASRAKRQLIEEIRLTCAQLDRLTACACRLCLADRHKPHLHVPVRMVRPQRRSQRLATALARRSSLGASRPGGVPGASAQPAAAAARLTLPLRPCGRCCHTPQHVRQRAHHYRPLTMHLHAFLSMLLTCVVRC